VSALDGPTPGPTLDPGLGQNFDPGLGPAGDPGLRLDAALARANPVAKLAAATVLAAGLILSVDVVTAGVALLLELLALPCCGVRPTALARRGALVAGAAGPAGVATTLFGADGGPVLAGLGPLDVSVGSLTAGVAVSLRVLAVGLPGVVLLATTDPTDLADGLAQVLRLPSRFTLAALAALRLFTVLAGDWRSMTLARRARGLGGDGPWRALPTAAAQVFALLVLAIRRATVLATAMESRGFGTGRPRTWARPSRLRARDGVLVLGSAGLIALATAAGVAAGTWSLLLG
jgi:energy-coupling factor transport system permease protein